MTKRILSIFLAIVMLMSALSLVACGDKKDKGGKNNDGKGTDGEQTIDSEQQAILDYLETYDPATTAESYVDSDVTTKYDFEGHQFTFLNSAAIYYMYIYLDPDMTGDVLDDCCFERNFLAEQYFNITIEEETQPYAEVAGYAKTLILTGEDVYDAMYIPASSITPMISENLFYDLLEIDELHIDKIWWDQPLITRNTINDRLFYATSDMHLMAFEGVWAMYFNEDMMTQLGLDAPFDLALNGKWTYDKVKQYCEAAANLNGDASFKFDVNGKATYGMSNMSTPAYFAYGMGTEYCARDDKGVYHFTADSDPKFTATWDKLIDLFGPDNGLTLQASATDLDPDGYYGVFEANRALFLHGELKGATMLREWEGHFGLLPQPKYDENQATYNSNVFSNCLSFSIPNTNMNLSRTGIIVDYLTYLSYANLLPRYYDIHVSLKALGKQESIDVLALIRGTRGCEIAVPYGWCTDLNGALKNLAVKNEHSIASTIEKYKDTVVTSIKEMYEEYPGLQHVD